MISYHPINLPRIPAHSRIGILIPVQRCVGVCPQIERQTQPALADILLYDILVLLANLLLKVVEQELDTEVVILSG
jgi:hypothetical protein